MKIHEYQAKEIIEGFGVPTPESGTAETEKDALKIANQMLEKYPKIFIKAQVHAGGRGKAGGVKSASNIDAARQAIQHILGMKLVSKQTGRDGKVVRKIMIVDGSKQISSELYFGIILDRQKERPVLIASSAGGMEIEEVSEKHPQLIIKEYIHPLVGMSAFQGRQLAVKLGLKGKLVNQAGKIFLALYQIFDKMDASQIEINPLVITENHEILALDSKINFDDSALFRHPDVKAMRDIDEETELEARASEKGLNYIKLDGNIGCMVNGAGLAMATMDIIKHYGAEPANFLDVGGSADQSSMTEAFKILLSDSDVKAVLVNIFGGIVRCDLVALGIISALRNIKLDRPLVVRLMGTNSNQGIRLLTESNLPLKTADNMADAAKLVIEQLNGGIQ